MQLIKIACAITLITYAQFTTAQVNVNENANKSIKFKKKVDFASAKSRTAVSIIGFLNQFKINQENGVIGFAGGFRGAFFPTKYIDGSLIAYNGWDWALSWEIKKAGTSLFRTRLEVDDAQESSCSINVNFRGSQQDFNALSFQIPEVGDYTLYLKIQDSTIFEFPFKVSKQINPDKFAEKRFKEFYYLDGAWENITYLEFTESGALMINDFLCYQDLKTTKGEKINEYTVNDTREMLRGADIYRDGKLLNMPYIFVDKKKEFSFNLPRKNGELEPKEGSISRFDWTSHYLGFVVKNEESYDALFRKDLIDGNYKIVIYTSIFNEKNSPILKNIIKEYEFKVVNKQIVLIDEQNSDITKDPKKYLEGFDEYIFLKQKNN